MINSPKDREKLYDDIREGCKVSFDGGICLSVDIKKNSYRELTNLVTEYIIKALNHVMRIVAVESTTYNKGVNNIE